MDKPAIRQQVRQRRNALTPTEQQHAAEQLIHQLPR